MNWLHLNHAVISKIIEKTPIRYAFARRLACLDPVKIATNTTQAASQFKLVVDHLVKQQHLEGRSSDEVIRQYAEFVDSVVRPIYQYPKSLTSTNRASMFLQQHVANSGSFPKLWDLMRVVLILSHGQLSVEKDVSINRQDMVENPPAWPGICGERFLYQPSGHGREPEGLVLHCTSEDHPWSLVAHWWFGCRRCRRATSIGSSKWSSKVHRESSGNVQTKRKRWNERVIRKALSDEIMALEKRQKTVQCAMMSMTKDADSLSEQADAQNDMTLIIKSNAYRRSAKEKGEEHASLAKKIAKLCEDMQMWSNFKVPQLSVLQIPYSANCLYRDLWGCAPMNVYICLCDIPHQKCPGNWVLPILEYTGIYWNLISLLLYEPCQTCS